MMKNIATEYLTTSKNTNLQPDNSNILADNSHLLTDNRLIAINISEPPPLRILVDNGNSARLMINDNRLIAQAQDDRLLANVNVADNRLMQVDGGRLTDKYLTNYDPYHRGHL